MEAGLPTTIVIVRATYAVAFASLLVLTTLASVVNGLSTSFAFLAWGSVTDTVLTGSIDLLHPWVKTMVITTFLIESRDETPDNETTDWVTSKSETSTELTEKADSDAPNGTRLHSRAIPIRPSR